MKRVFRQWLAGLLSVALVFALLPAMARAEDFPGSLGGTGEADSPYQISTADELRQLSQYVNAGNNCQNKHFKLMGDIDLGGAGNPWTPIGNSSSNAFNGTFDGDGHAVSGLYIDNSSTTYHGAGLFGYIGNSGTVKNLGVSGEIIGGNASTGGIAGDNNGTITGCHSACTVKGGPAGGIVGINHTSGTVSDCYNTGSVTGGGNAAGGIAGENKGKVSGCYNTGSVNGGSNAAGGIAGKNNDQQKSSIENCYNVGTVTGTTAGGIAGDNSYAGAESIKNCYFLAGTANSGVGSGGGTQTTVVSKSEAEFRSLASELGDGWTDDPFLGRPVRDANREPSPVEGDGSENTPYLIPSKEALEKVRDYVNNDPGHGEDKFFKLTNNIDLGGEENEWTPIGMSGRDSHDFKGTFDGGGFTVSGLFISSESSVGLFGVIGTGGTVKNLTVEGTVSGSSNVGGIVGDNEGTVENCHNLCDIYADDQIGGGVVGLNFGGTVTNCHNSGDISGSYAIGGITGANLSNGTVTNCYNVGNVTGYSEIIGGIGGIVGTSNSGTVKDCYNTGEVTGTAGMVGAIVGGKTGGTVTNCYYLSDTADSGIGDDSSSGTTLKTEAEFASGEVAYLLQNGQDSQAWGQKINSDDYPVLTSDPAEKVCKVTFQTESNEEYAVKYANYNGTVDFPDEPTLEGTAFDHWSTANSTSGGEKFDNNTEVTGDITVYAVGRETFGGESGEINLETTYGNSLTEDLSKHVKYQSEKTTAGKFDYTIMTGNDQLNADISGDNLKIPETANAGNYTLTIKATEKAPEYSLMSVDTYGTDPVTLTVTVIIKKADPNVTPPTEIVGLVYDGAEQALVTAGSTTGGTMQYSLDGSNYSTDIPKGADAKEYTVWYKVVGDDNYNDTEPVSLTVTIAKSEADVTGGSVTVTYGDDITLTVNVAVKATNGISLASAGRDQVVFKFPKGNQKTAEVKKTSGENGTATVTIPAADVKNYFDLGTNTVTVSYGGSGNLNPKETMGITVTVNPKELDYTFTAENKTYDGNTTVTGSLSGTTELVGNDKVTVSLQEGAATAASADAGTHNVTVDTSKVTLGGNDAKYYKVGNVTGGTVTIRKAQISSVTAPTANDRSYDGTEKALVAAPADPAEGTMRYAMGENGNSAPDDSNFTADIPQAKNAGTYYVWYKVVGDKNHLDTVPRSVTVTVGKADAVVTVEPLTGQYGEDITVTARVAANDVNTSLITGEVTFMAGETELGKGIKGADNKWTLTFTKADSEKQKALFDAKTVTAVYAGNNNIEGKSGSSTAAIEPRKLTYTVTAESREYRPGDTAVTVHLTPTDFIEGDEVTLTATGHVAKADAGTYDSVRLTEITIGGNDAKYYTVDAASTATVSVTISQIDTEVVTPPTGAEGLTYTGEPQNLLANEAVCSGGTMRYFVSEKGDDTQPDETADWKEDISGVTATDAGTYTVWYRVVGDGNHSDVAPASLQVTILPFTLSFEAVEMSVRYTGSAITASVSQTEGETPAIDPSKIMITYLRDGTEVEPVEPGTYDVTVSISDPNFALPGGAESVKIGTLTITHVHVWSETEWESDNNFHWHVCAGVGQCPEGGVLQRVPHTFSEPVLSDGQYVYTCTVCHRAFTAPTESYSVTGKVLESSGSVASGVTVTLKRGSETLAATVANEGGEYLFLYVLPGTYNIVAEKEDITMTALAVVTSDQRVDDITMPEGPINSVLEVKPVQEGQPETPAVVVGGLDQEAAMQSKSGSTVTVSMTVEAKAEDNEDNSAEVQKSIEAIKAEAEGTELEFIEISIQKTVSTEGKDETAPLHETKSVITLVIPYDFTGKGAVTVYRYHNNATETLSEGEGSDGTFRLDRENGLIYVYTSKFSTYAIGYTQEGKTPPSGPFVPPLYGIAVPARTEGGRVKADRATALPGSRVTLTVKPDEGYHFGSLTVHDRSGKPVKVTDNGDGTYTFTMPYGKVTVKAAFVKCGSLSFTDLDTGAWYHDYTDYVIAHGLMQGIGGGLFAPDNAVSRAQMVMVLWNMRGKPVVNYYMTYSDVSEGVWYTEAIRWAASEGIIFGYDNGRFGPDDPITREQMAAMVYRYEQKYGDGGFTGDWMYRLPFTDLDQISEWAFESVAWCNMKGVVTGKGNNIFDPQGPAKRSELASVLTRYCDENDIK